MLETAIKQIQDPMMNIKHLFEIEIFCKIINASKVISDQFYASFLNESIN